MENVFSRTALFQKTKETEGVRSIKRIPWDLLAIDGFGFMVSPMPLQGNLFTDVTAASVTINPSANNIDMLADDNLNDVTINVDNVIAFMYFDSEADFTQRFENTFGFYDSDTGQSGEFGYPMDSGL